MHYLWLNNNGYLGVMEAKAERKGEGKWDRAEISRMLVRWERCRQGGGDGGSEG